MYIHIIYHVSWETPCYHSEFLALTVLPERFVITLVCNEAPYNTRLWLIKPFRRLFSSANYLVNGPVMGPNLWLIKFGQAISGLGLYIVCFGTSGYLRGNSKESSCATNDHKKKKTRKKKIDIWHRDMVGFLVLLFGFYASSSFFPERSICRKRGAILFNVCLNINTPPALVAIPWVYHNTTSSSSFLRITRHPRKNV